MSEGTMRNVNTIGKLAINGVPKFSPQLMPETAIQSYISQQFGSYGLNADIIQWQYLSILKLRLPFLHPCHDCFHLIRLAHQLFLGSTFGNQSIFPPHEFGFSNECFGRTNGVG